VHHPRGEPHNLPSHLRFLRIPSFVALVAFCLLAVVWTWPLASHLSSRLPHDLGDPVLNTWILWWNARALPLTQHWWSPPIFVPMQGALALSEHLAGLGLFATPIQLLGGSPLLAYNVCILFSYALSGWFAYLLVLRLTGSQLAGLCGGLAFAAAPYRAGQLAHIQVLTSQWMPAVLLAMHEYVSTGLRRWLALFASVWILQSLSNGYYLLFLPVLMALWLGWFVDWRRSPARGLTLLAVWAAASVPLVPVLLEYRHVHSAFGLTRMPGEVARFSATLESFFHAPPMLAFWPTSDAPTQEDFLFPGVTAIFVTVLGLVLAMVRGLKTEHTAQANSQQRRTLLFYAIATAVMWACAFGPGQESNDSTAWLRPYRWLTLLPGYDGLRVPARFAMLASLCLSISAGVALARIESLGVRLSRALAVVALAGLALDGWMRPVPLGAPPARVLLPPPDDAPVFELPADDARANVAAMYRAIDHGHPIVNAYTGYVPPHYAIMSLALRRGDSSPLVYLARGRPLFIVVNDPFDAGGDFNAMVAALPSIERIGATSAGTIFRLPAQPREPSSRDGAAVPVQLRDAGGQRLEIDLGRTQVVRGIGFNLRWRYPELGERLLIERSDDGQIWERAWLGWTGALAVAAAIDDPLLAPVRVPLPDIRARYLRVYPAPKWMARELTVIGP
jgi:hypothetical protein